MTYLYRRLGLGRPARAEHSSLLQIFVNLRQKSFMRLTPGSFFSFGLFSLSCALVWRSIAQGSKLEPLFLTVTFAGLPALTKQIVLRSKREKIFIQIFAPSLFLPIRERTNIEFNFCQLLKESKNVVAKVKNS